MMQNFRPLCSQAPEKREATLQCLAKTGRSTRPLNYGAAAQSMPYWFHRTCVHGEL